MFTAPARHGKLVSLARFSFADSPIATRITARRAAHLAALYQLDRWTFIANAKRDRGTIRKMKKCGARARASEHAKHCAAARRDAADDAYELIR